MKNIEVRINDEKKWDVRAIAFIFIGAFIFLRTPQIILKGGFWAKEASVYFKFQERGLTPSFLEGIRF